MCDYCEGRRTLLSRKIPSVAFNNVLEKDDKLQLFITEDLLRLAYEDYPNCLDQGEVIKIYFCPICGERIG